MKSQSLVPLLVNVPRQLRVRVRVEAARREVTITTFVNQALEAALVSAPDERAGDE